MEIIILVISILTHLLSLSTLNFSKDYPTRLVSSVQIRLAENSVAPSNQVHLPSIIQFPENSLEVQQIVDLDVISEVAFDVIEKPTESVRLKRSRIRFGKINPEIREQVEFDPNAKCFLAKG